MKIKIPKIITLTNTKWTKKMRTREDFDELGGICYIGNKKLDINDWACCIVGETLKLMSKSFNDFENKYNDKHACDNRSCDDTEISFHKGCTECVDFSREFHNDITYGVCTEVIHLENTLKRYAKHLISSHKDIVALARKKEAKRLERKK